MKSGRAGKEGELPRTFVTEQSESPDLTPVLKPGESLGCRPQRGDVVEYESTVDCGCVQEFCVPISEVPA